MERKAKDAWVSAGLAGGFAFIVAAYAQSALGADPVRAVTEVASATDPFSAFVAFLKSTGPLGAAVLAGWWGLRKDKEKSDLAAAYNAQIKVMYDQVVGIVSAQVAATVKMESTIAALKDAIAALKSGDHDGG